MYPVRKVNVECLFIPGILVMTHGLVKEWLHRAVPGSYAADNRCFPTPALCNSSELPFSLLWSTPCCHRTLDYMLALILLLKFSLYANLT